MTYELSDTQTVFSRQVYGFLDWLRDIGGLYGAIYAICYGLVFIFQFRGQMIFLMTEMFAVS